MPTKQKRRAKKAPAQTPAAPAGNTSPEAVRDRSPSGSTAAGELPPASEVELHTGPIRRFEFHISAICDQKCTFCSEAVRMKTYQREPISYRDMIETLIRKRRDGCEHVTFTGGEPMIVPKFLDVLSAAKRLGYKTYATTDGSQLADPKFAAAAYPLFDELCISIHASNAALHDELGGAPGSFAKVQKAVENLERLGAGTYLFSNTVVVQRNLHDIEATVAMLAGWKPLRHLTISNLAPDGAALKNFDSLVPRLRDIGALVPKIAKIARAAGKKMRFFGVPLCFFGRDWDLPNDLHWTPRVTVERGTTDGKVGLHEIVSPHPGRLRAYSPKCKTCAVSDRCWGVFKKYLDHFGDEELVAL